MCIIFGSAFFKGKVDSSFTGAKEMTRHELEIEQSLYRGTKKAEELKHLLKAKTQGYYWF